MSRKGIARSCRISKNTVKDYLERYEKSGITFDAIRDMDDQDVYWLLFPEKKEQKSKHERDKIDFAYLSI
ncbi:MAG: helix-turn-helix domain-containing protein [Prolixibacteraceae bacterium]|nr:helix-turn-helix domain-containing protein [Prolixibacteraceae bacterium]